VLLKSEDGQYPARTGLCAVSLVDRQLHDLVTAKELEWTLMATTLSAWGLV
jgi:hypothetical protein